MAVTRYLIQAALTAAFLFYPLNVMAGELGYLSQITAKPLIKTTTTIVGEVIHYPGGGAAEITAVTVNVPPGLDTGWHKHGAPLFAYVLKGELTVDYGDKGKRVYKPGDSFMEAMDHWHNGANEGTEPTEIVALYMGGSGAKLVIPKDVPTGSK